MNIKYIRTQGFTLIELLVAVIIIAILAAIAVPQYKKAVLKSRFSTVMPMAKSIADAQEVYYQGRQFYALDVDELDVTPVNAENTTVTLSDEEKFNYVMAQRSDVPGARYIVYQKHSENFPGNIHCEALSTDDNATYICVSLGGRYLDQHGDYTVYTLSGSSSGTFPKSSEKIVQVRENCLRSLGSNWPCIGSYEYEDGHVRDFYQHSNGTIYVHDYVAGSDNIGTQLQYQNGRLTGGAETDPQTGKKLWEFSSGSLGVYAAGGFDRISFDDAAPYPVDDIVWTDTEGNSYQQRANGLFYVTDSSGVRAEYSSDNNKLRSVLVPNMGWIYFNVSGTNAGTVNYNSSFCKTAEACAPYIPTSTYNYQAQDLSQINVEDYVDVRSYCDRFPNMCSN